MRETATTMTAFAVYVGMGDGRSVPKLLGLMHERMSDLGLDRVPSRRTLDRWSSALHWQERIEEIDREAEARVREQLVTDRSEVLKRHGKLGLVLQERGLKVLRERETGEWSVRDALHAVDRGSAMEADALGVRAGKDGDDVLQQVVRKLEGLTDDDLRRLARADDRGED